MALIKTVDSEITNRLTLVGTIIESEVEGIVVNTLVFVLVI